MRGIRRRAQSLLGMTDREEVQRELEFHLAERVRELVGAGMTEASARAQAEAAESAPMGTVGVVALDRHGNLAAGTSTGGLTGKAAGRVGDSAVIGAGTYADDRTCAVSGTGKGEEFIRFSVAYRIAALMEHRGMSVGQAAEEVVKNVLQPGDGGVIALDRDGTVAAATSTGGMVGKRPGRVGDSALIGCGTYADSTLGGVSCTGSGEAIIRVVLARRTLDFLKEADDPDYAAKVAIDLLVEEGRGEGGLILVDWRGRVGHAQSTPLMPVAWMSPALDAPRVPF